MRRHAFLLILLMLAVVTAVGQQRPAPATNAPFPAYRAPHRADEEHVPGQHEPRQIAAREVRDQETDRVRGVTGRVRDLEAHRADHDLVAVLHVLVLEDHARGAVNQDRRPHRLGQVAIAGDVVGVRVGLEDVRDLEALLAREPQVLVDPVAPGIHHDRLAGLATADEVAEAAGLLVDQLLEDHGGYSTPMSRSLDADTFSPGR